MVPDWLVEMDWKFFEKDRKTAGKNTCGRAVFLEMLQAPITFQRFPCIRKLILQEIFCKHILKYLFLCDATELKQSVEGALKV